MTSKISILAIDLAKGNFQVGAVGPDGTVLLFNRALSRKHLATLLVEQQACMVAMEACATSHHWGRVAQSHGPRSASGAGGVCEAVRQAPEE
ncbi:transposase [Labrenzia sp. EL_142]|nr:transposase [Labrenzia sp. EL_142]